MITWQLFQIGEPKPPKPFLDDTFWSSYDRTTFQSQDYPRPQNLGGPYVVLWLSDSTDSCDAGDVATGNYRAKAWKTKG